MRTHLMRTIAICLLVGVALALTAAGAFAWNDDPTNPTGGPGPAGCSGGSNGGPQGGGGGASGGIGSCGGSPVDEINTYTGNLTIQDMPVFYQSVGEAIPFTITFNSQSDRTGPLGHRWTHSYDVYLVDHGTGGATVIEGNGWEHWLSLNAGQYDAPRSVFDKLEKTYSGQTWTGWKLTRPDQHKLLFNTAGTLTSIKDKDDLTWTLSGIPLSTVTDPKGRVTNYTYTSGKLTRVMVPGGLHADFTYDGSGRLLTVTDATTTDTYYFGYSGTDTKVTSIVDPSGREVDYTYDDDDTTGRTVVASTGIYGLASSTVSYGYSLQAGELYVDITEYKEYPSQRTTRHVYEDTFDESAGRHEGVLLRIITDVDGVAAMQNYACDSELRIVRYRDSWQPETGGKAHRHFFSYTDANNPAKMTKYVDPQNSDAGEGGLAPSPGCPGYVYTYDALGNLTQITNPEDAANRYTTFSYTSGRLASVTVHDLDRSGATYNHTTSFTYWDYSQSLGHFYQLKTITDARGNVSTIYYDSNGYLDYVDLPGGNVPPAKDLDFTANAVGEIAAVTDGNGNTTSYQWDGIHRLTQITYPNVGNGQKTTTLSWQCCGLDSVTDENSVTTNFVYEDEKPTPVRTHRLWKVIENDGGTNPTPLTTEYGYDEVDNLKTLKNARFKTTTYTYNDADQLTRADYPDSTYETWTYKDDGRVASHRDGRGRITNYHYDADDRLATVGTLKAIDFPTDTDVGVVRDKDGLVTSFSDASGTTSIVYYPSSWAKSVTNGYGKVVTYDYNHVGDVSKLWAQLSPERSFTYAYTNRNQPYTVTDQDGVTLSTFTYDNGGRLDLLTRPGSKIDFQYNARDWVTAVLNRTIAGATLFDNSYYYDDGTLHDHVGNPLKRTELVDGTTYTTTYRYDNIYRMLSESRTPGNYSLAYTYDAVGNRLTRVKDGVTYTYSYASPRGDNDMVTGISGGGQSATLGYDNSGNITSVTGSMFGTWALTFNDDNRATSIAYPGGSESFTYNALGQRMRGVVNGTAGRYFYNGDRVLEETNDSNGTLARYATASGSYYQPLLQFKRSDGSIRYPMLDIVGTTRRLVDAAGTATDAYSLDAFGRYMGGWANPTPNPYRFGAAWGYITDTPGSGLLQLGHRFYWPELGRFIQQDPIGDDVNWYTYAADNPGAGIDPSGEFWDVVDIGIGLNDLCGFIRNPTWAGAGMVAIDAIGALPGVPNVVGYARYGKKGVGIGKKVAKKAGEELHHLLPKQFKDWFKEQGLNPERFRVRVPKDKHRLKPDGIHTGPDNWNKRWGDFKGKTPKAQKEGILDFLEELTKDMLCK